MKETYMEIEEDESELFEINVRVGGGNLSTIKEEYDDRSMFSFDFRGGRDEDEDIVHVAISGTGAGESTSMEALIWTLNNIADVSSSSSPYHNNKTVVFLVYIYPQLRFIPTPLGNFPISKANSAQKQLHIELEKNRRQEYLQKFIDLCSTSQVKVEILSIESDSEGKALVDLIPILNMRKLIIGIPSSKNMKKRNGLRDYVVKNAPEFCEVKIICGGEEEVILMSNKYYDSSSNVEINSSSSSSLSPSPSLNNNLIPRPDDDDHKIFHSFQLFKCLWG
ncbi:U-box domain-containing protein 52-like [Impatiens glandulifera]|uniref:U-box domain-containing protein 52-like n=1 Tax=Impatiens glandulifera TaxID=253017 RepID=UPI001FB04BC8|nr:U-box domain-containing protein 52-like [Impatiens glandulifera]